MRESGDIEQDSHLVIGLYNPAMKKVDNKNPDEQKQTPNKPDGFLGLTILKNRDGDVQLKPLKLNFNRATLKISDTGKTPIPADEEESNKSGKLQFK